MISSVCVIGLGYIGLPTAAILADSGLQVRGVDVNPRTVEAVNAGRVPFVEPDLAGFVTRNIDAGRLTAALTPGAADAHIIAVPTPFTDDKLADLSYIEAAAHALAPHLRGGELVILESTSPPGATQFMASAILGERPDLTEDDLKFAHCPERVLPGRVMIELVENDRIVGGLTPEAAEAAKDLYRVFCRGEVLVTTAITAELAKLVENSFRDVNIAFANELSIVADESGVDVWELIDLANHHPRVNILQPGPGVGGHCIAVDPWFIVAAAPTTTRLIRTAREVNDAKPRYVESKITAAIGDTARPVIAMLGLAFKPNIDDLRESPAVQIVHNYAVEHPETMVLAVDPHIERLPASLGSLNNVALADLDDAIEEADVVVTLVDHDVFKIIPAERVAGTRVVDTKGIWR